MQTRGKTCQQCGKPTAKSGHIHCRDCYLDQQPKTPVREYCREHGLTLAKLSQITGVSVRTLKRVRAGEGCTVRTAERIAKVTRHDIVRIAKGLWP